MPRIYPALVPHSMMKQISSALDVKHHCEPLGQSAAAICRPVVRKGRRHRALNPFAAADAVGWRP